MNNDLISREALKEAIIRHCRSETECRNHFWYDENIIALIYNAPTVEERPQGEWIENTDFEGEIYYECSVCKETWYVYEGAEMSGRMNYCPVCGAEMKKQEGEK